MCAHPENVALTPDDMVDHFTQCCDRDRQVEFMAAARHSMDDAARCFERDHEGRIEHAQSVMRDQARRVGELEQRALLEPEGSR